MRIFRAYKTELDPTKAQADLLHKSADAARWAYNWGLEQSQVALEAGEPRPTAIDLHRKLNATKRTAYAWLYEVSKCAPQEALRDLEQAFRKALREPGRGQPRFKSRKRGPGSFRLTDHIRIEARHIRLPRLGRLRLKERAYLPVGAHALSATLSWRAERWFVSVRVEEDLDLAPPTGEAIGLDLGILKLGTTSEGTSYENPRALDRAERRLARLQRALARTSRQSRRRYRLRTRIRRLYARVANVRADAIHKMTSELTRTKSAIVVEDLKVAWMRKHPTLRKALLDAAFGEIRRQLEYKSKWYGSRLVIAPRFFPSTRRCSSCGLVADARLNLRERTFECASCGMAIDRDVNAACNLLHVAVSSTETKNGLSSALVAEVALKQEPRRPSASTENGGTTTVQSVGTLKSAGVDREE